jgi:hypothetical protein
MKMQLSPEQKFVANFIQFYQDMANHPDVVIQVLLDRLYDEACNLQSNRLGESIDRIVKIYNIKPVKKQKQKR